MLNGGMKKAVADVTEECCMTGFGELRELDTLIINQTARAY
jgi:hypothetical protein